MNIIIGIGFILISDHILTLYEMRPRYSGNKLFNLLPKHIINKWGNVGNIKFKAGLKQSLWINAISLF